MRGIWRRASCLLRLLRRLDGAPFCAPLADVFATLAAVNVVDHTAGVDEPLQQFAECRLVVETADTFRSGSIGDGLSDTQHDRSADAPYLGAKILFAGAPDLSECQRAREKSGQQMNYLASRG